MKHAEFVIGQQFSCGGESLWRVTDIGRRTIIAIRIDHGQVRHSVKEPDGAKRSWTETVDYRDPKHASWLNGPPYAVAETVFDEHDLPVCDPVGEADIMSWKPDPEHAVRTARLAAGESGGEIERQDTNGKAGGMPGSARRVRRTL